MLELKLNPVKPGLSIDLPNPWSDLERRGFHSDLLLRAQAFMLFSQREGFGQGAWEILQWVGVGFNNGFPVHQTKFDPVAGDSDFDLKQNFVQAIKSLSLEFGDRISTVVWETLAFMGARPNPQEEATIVSQQRYLTIPWPMADAVLHALPKVYGLNLHVLSGSMKKRAWF